MDSASWLADPSASVQDIVEQDEFSKSIYKLVDELPDVYRTILTMIDMHEFDYAETANALNIPVGTVKSRLARARLQMKNRLSGALPQSSQTDTSNLCTGSAGRFEIMNRLHDIYPANPNLNVRNPTQRRV